MKDDNGYAALMHASKDGHESCVQALLAAGADKDAKNNEGMIALMWATEKGHESCVQPLLVAGADREAKDGDTALMRASERGHEAILTLLSDENLLLTCDLF